MIAYSEWTTKSDKIGEGLRLKCQAHGGIIQPIYNTCPQWQQQLNFRSRQFFILLIRLDASRCCVNVIFSFLFWHKRLRTASGFGNSLSQKQEGKRHFHAYLILDCVDVWRVNQYLDNIWKKHSVFENALKKRKKINTRELTVDALVSAPKLASGPSHDLVNLCCPFWVSYHSRVMTDGTKIRKQLFCLCML